MRVLSETSATFYYVVVEYAKHSKLNARGIIVSGETKRVMGVEPSMVRMSSCVGFMQCCFHII